MRILFLISSSLLFGGEWLFAQNSFEDQRPTVWGIYFDQAYLLKHSENLRQLDDSYPRGITLEWSKFLITQKSWDFCRCFPRAGVSLGYWNWDNRQVLGHGVLVVGFLEPHFFTDSRVNLLFRGGIGAAYLTKPYDSVTNPLNLSYSTDLSFALELGVGASYRLSPEMNIKLLAKYNHTSNGGISDPNKGLNFPSVSLGLTKSFKPIVFPNDPRQLENNKLEDKERIVASVFGGWSNAELGDQDKFLVIGINGKYSRYIGGRSALTGGIELIADYSRKRFIELTGLNKDFLQAGILVGHEFWLGKVTFAQELGFYAYRPFRNTDDFYQRYSLYYALSEKISLGSSVKVHGHVADFIDFRIGYRFD